MYENVAFIQEKPLMLSSVGRIRVLETRLLPLDSINRMLKADNLEAALRILAEYQDYQNLINELKSPSQWEIVLKRHLLSVLLLVDKITEKNVGVFAIRLTWDIYNLKILFKSKITNQEIKENILEYGNFSSEQIIFLIKEEKCSKECRSILFPILEQAKKIFEETKDIQAGDVVIDRLGMEKALDIVSNKNLFFLHNYFRFKIDILNLKIFLRFYNLKKSLQFITNTQPFGQEMAPESRYAMIKIGLINGGFIDRRIYLELFEEPLSTLWTKLIRTHLEDIAKIGMEVKDLTTVLEEVEKAELKLRKDFSILSRRIAFGFPVIAGYFFSKENEICLLRTILSQKAMAINSSVIRKNIW
ncbi:hypothetical protein B9J78_02025 [bacterium Unc6]|nr:hypothetical protein [bacterium Unc6]